MKPTFVIAANYMQAKRWIEGRADGQADYVYASYPDMIRGHSLTPDRIVYLDGWTRHPEAEAIHRNILLASRTAAAQ